MYTDSYGNVRFPGLYRGIVTDTKDPLGKGRVRLQVPQVLGSAITDWAWAIRNPGAIEVTPSVGDGIWVQFEGGDPSFPVWTGTFSSSAVGVGEISATLPATWDQETSTIGVDQDSFTHISNLDYAQFDTTYDTGTAAVGQLAWNTADGTLEVKLKDGDVNLQIGQEEVVRVVNGETTTLTEGTVVYVSGAQGQRLQVKRADYTSDNTSAAILGVVTHALGIAANQEGYVTVSGLVHGVSTVRASDGWLDGDTLWLSANGTWQKTKPSAGDTDISGNPTPHHMVQVGYVVNASNGSAGIIYVHPQNGYELGELHDVYVSSPQAGQTLIRNSAGVWVNSAAPSKNFILNGGFDIWQRGTSFATTGNYGADRWRHTRDAGTLIVSRSTTIPSDAGVKYSLQFASTTGTKPTISQRIESMDATELAGKTVTLSIWARSSVGTAGLSWATAYPTVTDDWTAETADQTGTFTNSTTGLESTSMATSTWARYHATFTVPAGATTGYAIKIYRNVTTTSTTTQYAGAQLELGSIMTPFKRNASSYQGELDACMRFYEVMFPPVGAGFVENSTTTRVAIAYREKRVVPTMSFSGGADTVRLYVTGTNPSVNSSALGQSVANESTSIVVITISGLTSGQGVMMYGGASATAKFEISAEL